MAHHLEKFRKRIIYSVLLCLSCSAAEIRGVLRLKGPGTNTVEAPPEAYSVARNGVLTLCSLDRIYRVEASHDGRFVFTNVKAGEYALVGANVSAYRPEQLASFTLKSNEVIGPSTFLLHWGNQQHPCQVSTFGHDALRDFDVSYKPASVSPILIKGLALRHLGGRYKSLKKAELKLFEAGSTQVVQTTRSERDGSFHFELTKPGIYELRMRHQGYYEIQVPPFMVPRENMTVVELAAATSGSIVIER